MCSFHPGIEQEKAEAKGRTVAVNKVCVGILCNPRSLLPYSIEMCFFFPLLDAFKRHWILSCSKSVMNMWNINNEVSSYWASIALGLAWGGGLRYEPDSVRRLISDPLCDTRPRVSHIFMLREPFSIVVHIEKDAWVQVSLSPLTKSDFEGLTEPLCSSVKQR